MGQVLTGIKSHADIYADIHADTHALWAHKLADNMQYAPVYLLCSR